MCDQKWWVAWAVVVHVALVSGCGSFEQGRPEPPYDRRQLRKALNGTSDNAGPPLEKVLRANEREIYDDLVAIEYSDDDVPARITRVFEERDLNLDPESMGRIMVFLRAIDAGSTPTPSPEDELRDVISNVKNEQVRVLIEEGSGEGLPRVLRKIDAFYATPASDTQGRQDLRDEIIDLSVVLINLEFAEFTSQISVKSKAINAGMSIASIGADGAATLVAPASTVRLLAAISGGIEASRVTINKEYLYEEATRVIISQMNAQRQVVFQDISARTQLPIGKYTMAQAFHDIDRYYAAGTIDGAFAAIQKNAGVQQQAAEVRSDEQIRGELSKLESETAELKTLFASMRPEVLRDLVSGLYEINTGRYPDLEPTVRSTVYTAYVFRQDANGGEVLRYSGDETTSIGLNPQAPRMQDLDVSAWMTGLATPEELAEVLQSVEQLAPAFYGAVRGGSTTNADSP